MRVEKADLFTEIIILCGIGLIGWGMWEYEPWISKVVTGGILLVLGVIGARR